MVLEREEDMGRQREGRRRKGEGVADGGDKDEGYMGKAEKQIYFINIFF